MTVPTLRGERVTLRPMTMADLPLLMRWGSDPEFRHYQWGMGPGRFEEPNARKWIERMSQPGESGCWVIEHARRGVGFANYRDHHPKGRSAEIGIGIGEPALWGKHLGREALTLLVRHLSDELDLHRIGLSVVSFNDRAISMYKSVGFEVEGIERDGVGREHGFVDDVKMGLVQGRPRPDFDPRPVTLEGRHVRLEPLWMEHAPELFEAAHEPEIWTYLGSPMPETVAEIERYIRYALDQQILGNHLPFLTRRAGDGKAIGTTRYANIDPANRSAEIGWTFLSADGRRTAANTEAKLLMLRHMFDTLGAVRVWLQTDARNQRSRRAIERLGAKLDGELRDERVLRDGTLRTSAIYGITKTDWPAVRERLLGFLSR